MRERGDFESLRVARRRSRSEKSLRIEFERKSLRNFKGLEFFDTFEFESLHGSHTFPQIETFSREAANPRISRAIGLGLAQLRLVKEAI